MNSSRVRIIWNFICFEFLLKEKPPDYWNLFRLTIRFLGGSIIRSRFKAYVRCFLLDLFPYLSSVHGSHRYRLALSMSCSTLEACLKHPSKVVSSITSDGLGSKKT
jgi:hypothetical protein